MQLLRFVASSLPALALVVLRGVPAAAAPPHPEPRVIVNVLTVRGPHERAAVERAARESWGKIVACYKRHGRRTRGKVELELSLSARGRVERVRRSTTNLKSSELVRCLAKTQDDLPMPTASGSSVARAEIHVAPGDLP